MECDKPPGASNPAPRLSHAKISLPRVEDWLARERLFRRLDSARERRRVIWVSAPAGWGKTYLLASYLADRNLPMLWYQPDTGHGDVASIFYFLGLAAPRADIDDEPLPALTSEYLPALETDARNFSDVQLLRVPGAQESGSGI